jgi:acetate kinase
MSLVTVNAGSSSLKVAVFSLDALDTPVATREIENIVDGDLTFDDAVQEVKRWLSEELLETTGEVTAIGHRVVHGGTKHTTPELVSDELIASLQHIAPLSPNHMPGTLAAISSFRQVYPSIPHVACFDTSFFANVPRRASVLPIPMSLQTNTALRRYGFHGLAYEGLLANFRTHEGETAACGRVIMAHLGSGASVTACRDGVPVDMTMGFTPVSGIMMSTRSGDLEPGVLSYLQQSHAMTPQDIDHLVAHESGLKGISELSADMHTLLDAQHTNSQAALAIDMFIDRVVKAIGGYIAVLGGVDSIIFSGGIGERSAEIRGRIIEHFSFAGATIDDQRNKANLRLISAEGSAIGIHVIPSQEHMSIAQHTHQLISQKELL